MRTSDTELGRRTPRCGTRVTDGAGRMGRVGAVLWSSTVVVHWDDGGRDEVPLKFWPR